MVTPTTSTSPAQLSDADLLAQVARLAAREREGTVALIAHLAELDARRLYLAEGCASLFTYCVQVLHLAEHAAYGRIEAARAARRYPVLLERLADGSVTLTTVGLLAAHLSAENHRDLLDQARHTSRREVEALIAGLGPRPPVPASVRRLPPPRPALVASPDTGEAPPVSPPAPAPSSAPAGVAPIPPARPPVVVPLAPERYTVQFTASAETHAKLRLAQDLLRHQVPDGDVGQVLDRALTVLVDCAERGRVEFHHVQPYAAGGEATADNIELRCRAHNQHEAAQRFGPWGPSLVREPVSVYATARRARAPGRTRFGPSWVSAAHPP